MSQTKQAVEDSLDNEDLTEVDRMQVMRAASSSVFDNITIILLFLFLGVFFAKIGFSLQYLSGLPGYVSEQQSLSATAFFISHRITAVLELIAVIIILILKARLAFGLGAIVIYSILSALILGTQVTSLMLGFVLYAYCNVNNSPGNPCHDPSYCCKFYNTTLCGNLNLSPCSIANTPSHLKANPFFTEVFFFNLSLIVVHIILYVLVVLKMKSLSTLWYSRIKLIMGTMNNRSRVGNSVNAGLIYHSPVHYNNSNGASVMINNTTMPPTYNQSQVPLQKRVVSSIAKKVEMLAPTRLGSFLDKYLISYLPHLE